MMRLMFGLNCTHLEVLAVNALAVVPAVDACLEALAVLLEAARFLAVAALIVTGSTSHSSLLLHHSQTCISSPIKLHDANAHL